MTLVSVKVPPSSPCDEAKFRKGYYSYVSKVESLVTAIDALAREIQKELEHFDGHTFTILSDELGLFTLSKLWDTSDACSDHTGWGFTQADLMTDNLD